jgi:hypothetical protein
LRKVFFFAADADDSGTFRIETPGSMLSASVCAESVHAEFEKQLADTRVLLNPIPV